MLDVLFRKVATIFEAHEVGSLVAFDEVVALVQQTLESDRTTIFMCDDDNGVYVALSSVGEESTQQKRVTIPYGAGLIGWVAEREELINLDDCTSSERYINFSEDSQRIFHGFLGVPIIQQGNLVGVLICERKSEGYYSEDAEASLVTLGTQLADPVAQRMRIGLPVASGVSTKRRRRQSKVMEGIAGAPGVVIGKGLLIYPVVNFDKIPEKEISEEEFDEQWASFREAIKLARKEMRKLVKYAEENLSRAEVALFEAYLQLMESRSLMNDVKSEIKQGQWAPGALKRVIRRRATQLEEVDNEYLSERASDIRELGRRILSYLQISETQKAVKFHRRTILICEEVTATALLEAPRDKIVAVVSAQGSASSHVAILARALGLPTIMGFTGCALSELDDKECVIDGYNGQIIIDPSAAVKKEYSALAKEEQEFETELEAIKDLPACTKDDVEVALYVNTGLAIDAELSLKVGAQGVGLYRTEIPFMIRDRFPSEDEQRVIYQKLLESMSERPVTMRTLDIGGDKNLSYFAIDESNPFLGWRGIRISLDHPELFLAQVRAMLHANVGLNNLSIMLPMISSVHECETALALIQQAYEELCGEGLKLKKPVCGVMIEVPSAVFQAQELARRVDFVSVGSNDLTQYILAVDRNNSRVAGHYDHLHPAVLRAINQVAKSVRKVGRRLSICGEMAADPLAAVLLVAMQYHILSMNARSLPRIKWVIRHISFEQATQWLQEVLVMDDAQDVRVHMETALDEAGLGGMIRAGRN